MSRLIIFLVSMLFFWGDVPAADRGEPIIFSRGTLTIEPVAEEPTAKPVPAESAKSPENDPKNMETAPAVIPPRAAHAFTVDVKPYSQLQAPGMYVQNPVKEYTGVLYALTNVGPAEIPPANVISPADVLAIAENGMILQIAPSLNQAELAQPIAVAGAVKALLHLPPGTCKTLNIQPRDMARHPLFTPSPTVLK